jgi:hypothetical protein
VTPNPIQRPAIENVIDWQTRMRMAFIHGLSEADMTDVVRSLVKRAKEGDMAAIRMVLTYAVGTPTGAQRADTCEELPPAPVPRAATKALPKTPDKLSALAARAAKGEALFHPRDARYGEDDR